MFVTCVKNEKKNSETRIFFFYFEKKKFFHLDLKLENVVLNLKRDQLKLIDFGMAMYFSESNSNFQTPPIFRGTACYAAPEVCKKKSEFSWKNSFNF